MDAHSFEEEEPLNPKYERLGQAGRQSNTLKLLLFTNVILLFAVTISLSILVVDVIQSNNAPECFNGIFPVHPNLRHSSSDRYHAENLLNSPII